MKKATAIRLAIEAMEQIIKIHAVNANLFDVMKLDTPATRNASERRAKLKKAIETLQVIK